ncbi:MAG: F0F1 ATP synthase subunit gamma [Pseudomonadota bacterium]
MPSLKELRTRITSVQSTRRITSAMKMVAAAKLRKAQERVEASRSYANSMAHMLQAVAAGATLENAPALLAGTGKQDRHLFVIVTSDRGLCGGFNGSVLRYVNQQIASLEAAGKSSKLLVIGRKGAVILRRNHADKILDVYEDLAKPSPQYHSASDIAARIISSFENDEFDVCTLIYNKFVSALTQVVTPAQLIPLQLLQADNDNGNDDGKATASVYEFEPDEETILDALLPKNMAVQMYQAMLESFASEQGARMTAMDNATRNAGEMINNLSVIYNRSRQAQITKELIEIISGAEAL